MSDAVAFMTGAKEPPAGGDGGVSLDALAADICARAEGRARFVFAIAGAARRRQVDARRGAARRARGGRRRARRRWCRWTAITSTTPCWPSAASCRARARRRPSTSTGWRATSRGIRAGGPRGVGPGLRPHPRPGAGRGARRSGPSTAVVLVEGNYLLLDAAALERARAAASTARSSSRSTGDGAAPAAGRPLAGARAGPRRRRAPAPRATTCPTRSWWRPAGGRPTSLWRHGDGRPSPTIHDAASGDHLLNSRGSPRVTSGSSRRSPISARNQHVLSKSFRRVSGHEHPPTLQWPERLW